MIVFFYQVALILGFLFTFPWMLLRKKQGPNLRQRLGRIGTINKTKPFLVWIHAVSLGETKAVAPLAQRLKETYGDKIEFVISTGTAAGKAEGEKAMPFADHKIYLPFDFSWIMKPLLKATKPDLVVVVETDLWFNFLSSAKQNGARLLIVNGKMSERSCARYASFSWWSETIFSQFDRICAQSSHYRDRYLKIGVAKDKVIITGNLKLDHVEPKDLEIDEWKKDLGLSNDHLVLVIGSTHDPEERWFLEVLDGLWNEFPELRVLLVPRHPERFDQVADLLQESGQPFRRYSKDGNGPCRILLVDAMGILKKCYQIADCAIVGGSYVEHVGGHNILEPSEFGVPVIFGPNMYGQPELKELCLSYEAGLQVPMKDLSHTLQTLLKNKEKRDLIGSRGLRLIRDHQGASERTLKIIKEMLPENIEIDKLDA